MRIEATRIEDNKFIPVQDELVDEEMLQISINGNPYTTTMRSPGHEEELVRGILLTEDVYNKEKNPSTQILERNSKSFITKMNVVIPEADLGEGIQTKRNLLSVTSCGVCGKYEMDLKLKGQKLEHTISILPSTIGDMFKKMSLQQELFKKTGGCHAAAAFDKQGNLLCIFEDIGRHNAVDKVIGHLARFAQCPVIHSSEQQTKIAACLIVSGRVSYEIVSKCYRAGIPYLAAVSAASSLAVDYCKEKGISLFAFCRDHKVTQYT